MSDTPTMSMTPGTPSSSSIPTTPKSTVYTLPHQAEHSQYQRLVQEIQFDDDIEPYQQATISINLVVAAMAHATCRAYEQELSSHADSPEPRDELFARLAHSTVKNEFENHGLDWLDRNRVEHQVIQQGLNAFH